MYKNMGIKGLDYKEITSLPKRKNVMNNLWRVITCNSIIARKKKKHMPITRLICIQRKFTTPDKLASLSKFCS